MGSLQGTAKAFDCIRHDLLIAKLHACGFSREALTLLNGYLTNRQQRFKVKVIQFLEKRYTWCSPGVSFRTSII